MTTETTDAGGDRGPEARGLRLVPALLLITVVSGLIDAASYLGLGHIFTANMTGNVVVLGFAAAGAPGFSVYHSATSLGAFLAGAVAGGRAERHFSKRTRRALTRNAFAVEALLVGIAAAVAHVAPGSTGTVYAAIVLTAFAMGMRNATVRMLKVPDLSTTTVLTSTLTKLASDSRAGSGAGGRSLRRASSALSLLAGAAIGGWLMLHVGLPSALLAASFTTAVLAVTVSGEE